MTEMCKPEGLGPGCFSIPHHLMSKNDFYLSAENFIWWSFIHKKHKIDSYLSYRLGRKAKIMRENVIHGGHISHP